MSDPLYKTGQWRKQRQAVLDRDAHLCQIGGEHCTRNATSVNHIVPRSAGGPPLDPSNLRSSCRSCNQTHHSQEGWRNSPTRITLVWGPPCAGKSTYVQDHAKPGDLVIDFDLIAQSFGSPNTHDHSQTVTDVANRVRNKRLGRLRLGKYNTPRAWIVSANNQALLQYPYHEEVLLDPGPTVAHTRAVEANRPYRWHQLIDDWYDTESNN